MADETHSPLPWALDITRSPAAITAGGDKLALVYLTDPKTKRRDRTHLLNALVMFAAPDMLAALQDARVTLAQVCEGQHPDNVCCHHLRAADAAIAKATTPVSGT